jgi:hypothetical protein
LCEAGGGIRCTDVRNGWCRPVLDRRAGLGIPHPAFPLRGSGGASGLRRRRGDRGLGLARLNQVGDGGVAGHRLQPEQQARLQQPWRRSGQPTDWDRVVALGHPNVALGDRTIRAQTLSTVRRRFIVDVVLD